MSKIEFDPTKWKQVETQAVQLLSREISSPEDLEKFIVDRSAFSDIIGEEVAWAYINMTRFTERTEHSDKYAFMLKEIVEKAKPYSNKFNKKIVESTYFSQLPKDKYFNLQRILKREIELFNEENLALVTKEEKLSQEYGKEVGSVLLNYQGEEHTLQQMNIYQKSKDRNEREQTWKMTIDKRVELSAGFDKLFNELIELRQLQAKNAGFSNYRDYQHKAMGRFDYSPSDCMEFHESVKKEVVPVATELLKIRREYLGLDKIRPWDRGVDFLSDKVLKPFDKGEELIDGTINVLNRLSPALGDMILKMKSGGYFDVESRRAKAPGGYNYGLPVTRIPFIFMNAVGLHRDLITMLHESGHAVHTFSTTDVKIGEYANPPSEVAEFAAMAMELMTSGLLSEFYSNSEEIAQARFSHLEGIINFLPWMSVVDLFQQWVYTHPGHSIEERDQYWNSIVKDYSLGVDMSGFEEFSTKSWQTQLHIFEVPFYYIVYGMAQLGALQLYKNFKNDPKDTLEKYLAALSMGYTRPIPDIYEKAGIHFDFSRDMVGSLMEFVRNEIQTLL